MTKLNFEHLMGYLDAKFAAIDLRFNELEVKYDSKFDKVYNILDSQSKQIDDNHLEFMSVVNQVDRHDRWHHQTANKIGIKLKH